jgi:hypothetical protein
LVRGLTRLVRFDVLNHLLKRLNVVVDSTEGGVAVITKKCSYFSGDVLVVNIKVPTGMIATLLADCTQAALGFRHSFVITKRHSIFSFKTEFTILKTPVLN